MLTCPPRHGTPRNPERATYGPAVAKVADELGLPLMPWQRHVADVALEVDPETGRLYYREIRLWVPRQSGKTSLLCAVMAHRCNAFGRQNVRFFSVTRNHARRKWEDEHKVLLEGSRALRNRFRTRLTNGNEAFLWKSGSSWGIDSTTKKAGHGDTLDLVVADEFFAQIDDRIEQGARPTMITRPQPQVWFISTFGDEDSGPLWRKVDDGRARCESNTHGRVAYFEWSAADEDSEELDPGDPEVWYRTMPALGHTITEEAVRAEFESMPLEEFKRAYLNLRLRGKVRQREIPLEPWNEAADAGSRIAGRVVIGLDVSPDKAGAALVVCGPRRDGRPHLEVIRAGAGTDWLAAELGNLLRFRPAAVAWDAGGPVGSVLPELLVVLEKQRNVELVKLTTRDYAAACVAFKADVIERRVAHLDQAPLNAAVAGAQKRRSGEAWLWDRWGSASVDLSPLIAATVALRGHHVTPLGPKRSAYETGELLVA